MSDRLSRIALAQLVEPGNRELGMLVRRLGASHALELVLTPGAGLSEALHGAVEARLDATATAPTLPAVHMLAERALERAEELGARIVTAVDDGWPTQVEHLTSISRDDGNLLHRDTDPPLCLWVRGMAGLPEALDRSVAIVGSRAASSYGTHVAADFACGLAERDWTIVSGGALGIDVTAHRGALAAGGLTVAVLACGVDRSYPVQNASVFERISEEGLLVSEWPPGTGPHRTRFLTRNRVIAAATRGTVVVEAGSRSGARNTLGHARLLRRPAMVVPGPVTSATSAGCHAELREPGTLLVTRVEEVIEEIGSVGELATPVRGPDRPEDVLDPLQARLLDAVLPRKARTAEELAAVAGLSGRDARRAMPLLERHGFVVRTENGYRLPPRPVRE